MSTSTLILSQVCAMALVGLVLLLLFTRKLSKRKTELTSRLAQLAELNKSTVLLLTRNMTKAAVGQGTNATNTADEFLSQWLADTEAYLHLHNSDTSAPTPEDLPVIQMAKLRHHVLLSEQRLLKERNEDGPTENFWGNYHEDISPVIEALLPEPQIIETAVVEDDLLVMEKDSEEDLHQKLIELRTQIQKQNNGIANLKAKLKEKDAFREAVLDCWEGRRGQTLQSFERLIKASRNANNRNDLYKMLSQFFNIVADVGEVITGERINHRPIGELTTMDDTTIDTGKVYVIDKPRNESTRGIIVTDAAKKVSQKSPRKDMRKVLEKDVVEMKNVIVKQKNIIVKLRDRVKEFESSNNPKLIQEYEQQCTQLEQLLNENDQCIQTMETELNLAQHKISDLEEELLTALEVLADYQSGNSDSIRKLTEEQLAMLESERIRLQQQAGKPTN